MRVAVIGAGGMGLLFAGQFKGAGFEVVLSSRTKEKLAKAAASLGVEAAENNVAAVRGADVVVVSVPVDEARKVLGEIRPHVKMGSVVIELTSVKKFLLPELKKFRCDVISLHPMFGPSVRSFDAQVFIVCPVRGESRLSWLREFIEKRQGKVVMSNVDEHDRIMSIVQCLTHFAYISVASTIKRSGVDVKDTRRFSSPIYELMLDMIVRIVGQDPHMYAGIQMRNPYAKRTLALFLSEASALKKAVDSKNEKKFVEIMSSSAKCLGDMESALYKSNKVLAALREEVKQLKTLSGKKIVLRHEQSGEAHIGILSSVTGESLVLLEDGKRTALKIANVRLLPRVEAGLARRQKYGITKRDFSFLFPKGFSEALLPDIIKCFFEDAADAKVVDVYESAPFAGKKSITLRAEILNDSDVKTNEAGIAGMLSGLGGERR